MQTSTQVNSEAFTAILRRNIALPLILSGILCACFIALVMNLISVSRWVDHTDQVIAKTNEIQREVTDAETGIRGFLFTQNLAYLEPYQKVTPFLESQFKALSLLISDNPVQADRVEKLAQVVDQWRKSTDFAQRRIQAQNEAQLKKSWFLLELDRRKATLDQMRRLFEQVLTVESELRTERVDANERWTRFVLLAVVFLSGTAGTLLSFSGRRQLRNLSQAYQEMLQLQLDQNKSLVDQAWIKQGQADLMVQLRGELSLEVLSTTLLNFVVQYVGGVVGALYVIQGNGLRRSAVFACEDPSPQKSKGAPYFYALGEGLVGQAALGHQPKIIRGLPSDYCQVVSGTGRGQPDCVVLIPLLAEGVVQGVMELGFFGALEGTLEPLKLGFLEQSVELLGSTIRSALYRLRLQSLLSETQAQTQELQTQQEELRVSNEELSDRTATLQEAQVRLEAQHAELEQTNELLERQKLDLDNKNEGLRQAQDAVQKKAQELEASNQYKSEFLANMSHELRTPLNSTLILAKLLMDNPEGNLTSEQVEFASTIHSSGNSLLTLINDILDLSKVEAGKLDLSVEEVSVSSLVSDLKRMFLFVAQENKLDLSFQVDASVPATLETDPMRLSQILKNFISNSLKFTEKGNVTIMVSAPNSDSISFAVKDTGPGIEPGLQSAIFEAFRQADGTIKRKHGGTGLGLSISRSLAFLLHGQIELQSEVGKGSTFKLTLPRKFPSLPQPGLPTQIERAVDKRQGPTQEPVRVTASSRTGGKVLVIEDDSVQRQAIERLMGEKGIEIVAVGSGTEALERLKANSFDCAVIDLTLPDMSGLHVLEQMAKKADQKFPPVIVYTGRSMGRAEEEKLRQYSQTIIIKGARSSERLLDEVSLCLHRSEGTDLSVRKSLPPSRTSRNREKAFENRKVLLVDDDIRNIFSLTSALEQKGASVRIARNGREALEALDKEADIDLVLMDIMMPEMDGYTAMEKIRKIPKFKNLPVIAVTAKAMKNDYQKCLSAGASDYLAKPVDLDQLVSLMRVWLPSQLAQA